MAKVWTADRNEKLFLLVVTQLGKLDCAVLAEAWKTTYPDEAFQPTTRALQEQFKKMKKQQQTGNGAAEPSPSKTKTPTKPKGMAGDGTDKAKKATPKKGAKGEDPKDGWGTGDSEDEDDSSESPVSRKRARVKSEPAEGLF